MNRYVRLLLISLFPILLSESALAAPEKELALSEPSRDIFVEHHLPRFNPALRQHFHHQIRASESQTKPSSHHHAQKSQHQSDFHVRPSYQNALTLQDIDNLLSVNPQFFKAAMRTKKHITERKLSLLDYLFADVNNDNKLEVVTLSEKFDVKNRSQVVLGIYDLDDQFNPVLRYEKSQLTPDASSLRQYYQSIASRSPGFTFCEDWQIASWKVYECHDLIFSSQWIPSVLAHSVTTSEIQAHSSQTNRFDFENRIASRSYERLPDGPFMPPLKRQNRYSMIFAQPDDTLNPGPNELHPTQSADFSQSEHAPIQYDMRWNHAGIYMSFILTDADMTPPESCSDQLSIQQSDHLELWFDLSPSLNIKRDSPQSWMLEYEKYYQNEPYRHSLDADIFGIAILPNGCTVPMAPTRDNWHILPQFSTRQIPNGYRVDVFIPAEFYQTDDLQHIDRSLGLGFTARQHDLHTNQPYDSVATSEWQWPDPFTFGQVWLLSPKSAYPPPFPLQWNSWLVDNSF